MAQTWEDKHLCLVIEGQFLEKAVRTGDSQATTRSHRFKSWVTLGSIPKIALDFIPAKTRWEDGAYPYSYWNSRIAFDGKNWIFAESFRAGDPLDPILKRWQQVTMSYKRPLELGTVGRNLLSFEYLIPWRIALPFNGQMADIQKIIAMPNTKLSMDDKTITIDNRNVCTVRTINLDVGTGIKLNSFTIENNLCIETEGPSIDKTVFGEWRKIDFLEIPTKINRTIISEGKFTASNEISITKFSIAN